MQEILKKSLVSYGKGTYKAYRIPGMVVTAKGTILTYFETRLGRSDWSTRGVGLCRSEDNGNTFSDMEMIALTDKDEAINNPIMIACKDGTVHFMWQIDYKRGFHQYSTDDGKTFSEPREITEQLYKFRENGGYQWQVIAFGPGHGTELSNGNLFLPIWMANGAHPTDHAPSVTSSILSRDSGKTWEIGEIIGDSENLSNPNETCGAELSDGNVMFNVRHMGREHSRAIVTSKDGITGFSKAVFDRNLPDPVCFGSICSVNNPTPNCSYGLLFSNCATRPSKENFYSRERKNLTLRLSIDDGKNWIYSRALEERSGYSDVGASNDGKWLYCFYEHDVDDEIYSEPRHLTFARVNLDWISD